MAKNHNKTRKPFVEVFFEQVRQHLDFLLTEHDFTGPEQQEISPRLGCSSRRSSTTPRR